MSTKRTTSAFWRPSASKAAIVGLSLFGACASQLPRPTPPQLQWAAQRWPEAPPDAIETGRTLYIRKCSGCHTLKLPQNYRAELWPKIMDKMAPKSKLTPEEKDAILRYVLTVTESPAGPATP